MGKTTIETVQEHNSNGQRPPLTDTFAVRRANNFGLVAFTIVLQATGSLTIAPFGMTP